MASAAGAGGWAAAVRGGAGGTAAAQGGGAPPTRPPPPLPRALLLHQGAFLASAVSQPFVVLNQAMRAGGDVRALVLPALIAVERLLGAAIMLLVPRRYWRNRRVMAALSCRRAA